MVISPVACNPDRDLSGQGWSPRKVSRNKNGGYAMTKKLVVLAAVNGGAQQSRDGAHVPITPAEIAEAAYECYRAGASVVHIHARGMDKGPTTDIAVFSDIIRRIRDRCDILVQTTNGFGVRRDPKTGEVVWPKDE